MSQFPKFQPWQAQPKFDAVVAALWQSLCPNHKGTYNLDLSCSSMSSNRPEIYDISLITHAIYTNYFDPVTDHLTTNTSLNRYVIAWFRPCLYKINNIGFKCK